MLITALVVGFLVLKSTTNKVYAETPEDLVNTYPYQYWIPDQSTLILSKYQLLGADLSSSNGVLIRNPTTGAWVSTVTTTYYTLYRESYTLGDMIRLYYNPVTGWEGYRPDEVRKSATNWTIYYSAFGSGTLPTAVYTNGVSVPSPFASGGSTLPSDIPPFEDIQSEINNALNASTSTTTQANKITSNIQTQTERFENGEISKEVFELNINLANEVLEELQNTSGNTLADQIAINNALTATQTAQDKLLSNDLLDYLKSQQLLSETVLGGNPSETLNNVSLIIQQYYVDYMQGKIPKLEAITVLENFKYTFLQASGEIYSAGGTLTVADEWLIDEITTLISQTQNNINNSGDVDMDTKESSIKSDEDELELLNDMISVMQEQETDSITNNQQMREDLSQVNNWLDPMWDNIFLRNLLISFCILVPTAVILDMRYRHL